MKPLFTGCATALVTPFSEDGKIDFESLRKLIEYQIESKVDALVISGTTGEGSTLTVSEKLELYEFAVKTVNKRVPVIAGTGSNSTSFAIDLGKEAEKTGIDAHLIVTPYYNKASQNGIIEHYYAIADEFAKPVIVYNVPTRTGVNISAETYEVLSRHDNIVAVKEADTNINKLIRSLHLCGDKIDFYVGNDDMITIGASLGCKGVISVLSNIAPKFTVEMTRYAIEINMKRSREMQKISLELINALFSDVNPIPVKTAMNYLDFCSDRTRLPLTKMNESQYRNLIEIIEKYRDIIH